MNPRIQELAQRAGGNPNYRAFRGHFLPPPPDYIDPATVDLEKFAELIVQECVQVLVNRNAPNVYGEHIGVEEIKQHFGVK